MQPPLPAGRRSRKPAVTFLPGAGSSVRVVAAAAAGGGRRARLLGERGDGQRAPRRLLQDERGLLDRPRVELHEEMHDDLLLVVLVEAHMGEELARAVVAE